MLYGALYKINPSKIAPPAAPIPSPAVFRVVPVVTATCYQCWINLLVNNRPFTTSAKDIL